MQLKKNFLSNCNSLEFSYILRTVKIKNLAEFECDKFWKTLEANRGDKMEFKNDLT